jgi:Phosphotransferase enzyme family
VCIEALSGGFVADRSSTHVIELCGDVVVKRYRSWDLGQPRREWTALTLLAEHAPGLAPTPIEADLTGDPPVVVMSRLIGVPLSAHASTDQVTAMAAAVAAAQQAIPRPVLNDLPRRPGHPRAFLDGVRTACAAHPGAGSATSVARTAFAAAVEWLGRPEPERMAGAEQEPVLGTGDGNLANYLWDGQRVQIVDFEYSGGSDRVFELAEIAEHISARVSGIDITSSLLSHFELTAAEVVRLRECRRLIATYWLLTLLG